MPAEYVDDEDRAPPYNNALATERGVNGAGGYSVPLAANQTVRGYKSTVVRLNGHGTAVSVEVGWAHSDDAANIVTLETKKQPDATASALLFVNQGDVLDHVKLTGGGNIDYSVLESNQLPLPASSAAPDYLLLQGTTTGIIQPPVGDSDHAKFVYATRQTNNDALWTYILDAGGRVKEVQASAHGRYLLIAQGAWAASGASYDKELLIETFGTGGYGVAPVVRLQGAAAQSVEVQAVDWVDSGTMQMAVEPAIDVAGPINFVCTYWWILRFPS